MIVIADSNILISGLYNPKGTISKILKTKSKIQFLAPDYLFEEVEEHLSEIMLYTGKTKNYIQKELNELSAKISVINLESVSMENKRKSIELTYDIDIDDAPFVSLHFHTGHKIWTGDKILIKGLLNKGFDICITTEELKKMLYKKE